MVVEDDPHLRGLTLKILAGLGYRTIEAEDGRVGLKMLESGRRIDLLELTMLGRRGKGDDSDEEKK